MSETKLRAMRHRDVWQVVNVETTGLNKGGGLDWAYQASDIEYCLRQQYHRSIVAADCHNAVRGWMLFDAGTGKNMIRIKRLVVHGDWWQMGIGGQLLFSVLAQCRDARVEAHCEVPFGMLPAAANFLKRFGFKGKKFYTINGEDFAQMIWTATVAVEAGAA